MTYDLATPGIARLWQYRPDWSGGVSVRRAFRTDVITSRNGTEQRRSLRDVPRYSLDFSAIVQGADLQAAKLELRAAQNRPRAVPDWTRFATTTGASSAGNTTLTVASPPAWLAPGQLAYLCNGSQSELVLIELVYIDEVEIAGALENNWPSGSTIRPVVFGLLAGQINASRLNRAAQDLAINIEAYPGAEPPEDAGTAGDTFNGYEIFTEPLNFGSSPSVDYLWPVEQVDYGIGRTAQFRPIQQHELVVGGDFVGRTRAAVQAVERFWLRHKGRRSAFYRPTCEKDLTLAADATSSLTIDIEGTTLADEFGAFDAPYTDTALEIVLTNGTRIRRSIASVAVAGSNSRLTLNASTTAAVADVARISWMPLCRFANDELVTRWLSPTAATIALSFQSLRLSA